MAALNPDVSAAVDRFAGEGVLSRDQAPPVASLLRPLFVIATGALPLLVVCWGIAARRRSLLDLGLAGVLASLMTLRFYVHLAPLWLVLVLGGSGAIGSGAAAAAVRRFGS